MVKRKEEIMLIDSKKLKQTIRERINFQRQSIDRCLEWGADSLSLSANYGAIEGYAYVLKKIEDLEKGRMV
jgi:hypothetical protein